MGRSDPIKIFVSTGEISGDIAGAALARAIQRYRPGTLVFGTGGSRMMDAGVRVEFQTSDLGVIGLWEVMAIIPRIIGLVARIRKLVHREKPDLALLIGYEGLNVPLAWCLRWKKIATVSYFPPQVWIWRALARPLARSFDRILTSFPEEQRVYESAGGPATYVGHHLCDQLRAVTPHERVEARRRAGLKQNGHVVGLLPGSRLQEVKWMAPVLLDAAGKLAQRDASIRFMLPIADSRHADLVRHDVDKRQLTQLVIVSEDSHEAMRACDLVLLASGSASLEASLLGVPMVVIYRVSALTAPIVRLLQFLNVIQYQYVGLPNLLLKRPVVPELHQRKAQGRELAAEAWSLLQDEHRRRRMREQLLGIAELFGEANSADKAAGIIVTLAEKNRSL